MKELHEIRSKRARLIAQADAQRDALAAATAGCRGAFALADRGIAAARWLRLHPYVIAAAALVLVLMRPQRVLKWTTRGLALWRGWRFVAGMLAAFAARGSAP